MFKGYNSFSLKNKIIIPILFTIILGVSIILVTILTSFSGVATDLSSNILIEKGQHYSNLIGKDVNAKFGADIFLPGKHGK